MLRCNKIHCTGQCREVNEFRDTAGVEGARSDKRLSCASGDATITQKPPPF